MTEQNPLLERAKSFPPHKDSGLRFSDRELRQRAEVALAYLDCEVSGKALVSVLGAKSSPHVSAALAIVQARQRGLVEIRIREVGG